LLGSDPSNLAPVGQSIYGSRTIYQQEILVAQSGEYWVAAYARDEAGDHIQSPAHLVLVALPPAPFPGPHGSHGAPPSYTGTDDDFLRPAGQPHYSSLRKGTRSRMGIWFAGTPYWFGDAWRHVSSTHREEVLAEQGPLRVGDVAVPVDPGAVGTALDGFDQVIFDWYPRPGLYIVGCTAWASAWSRSSGCGPVYNPSYPSLGLEYSETLWGSFTETARSGATYFVPRPPPGKRVQSARLRVYANVFRGESSALRLNGRPPTAIEMIPPQGSGNLWVTWDFTEEARALAAQGGGLLDLNPDPIPPTVPGPGFSSAHYILWLNVDYPWWHGAAGVGDLRIIFEEDCPKELTAEVTPDIVRPVIPAGNTIPPGLSALPTQATVTGRVKTCPSQNGTPPASVEVSFEVRAPTGDTAQAGGHVHDTRPAEAYGSLEMPAGPKVSRCTVAAFDPEGVGSCTVPYHSSEVSGIETIVARATGFNDAQTGVMVQVGGLENLAQVSTNFWRLTGRTTTHPDNHWGRADTVENIQLVALDFLEYSCDILGTCATLGINDMSLPQGGLFDICGTWNSASTCANAPNGGHRWHRTGTGVDMDRAACVDPNLQGTCESVVQVDRVFIQQRCTLRGQGRLAREASFHCEWPR